MNRLSLALGAGMLAAALATTPAFASDNSRFTLTISSGLHHGLPYAGHHPRRFHPGYPRGYLPRWYHYRQHHYSRNHRWYDYRDHHKPRHNANYYYGYAPQHGHVPRPSRHGYHD